MKIYISSKAEFEETVRKSVSEAIQESLPDAIQKATRKKWLTTAEVMQILKLSRPAVQSLRDSKKLPYRQHKRTIRYNIDEVEAFLNRGKVNNFKWKPLVSGSIHQHYKYKPLKISNQWKNTEYSWKKVKNTKPSEFTIMGI